MIFLEFFELSM